MLLADPIKVDNLGDLKITIYDFQKIGAIVPKHIHGHADAHITIVARGKLKAYSDDWAQEAIAGQILDFPAGQPHELMALEDNTRIFNIIKKHSSTAADLEQVK